MSDLAFTSAFQEFLIRSGRTVEFSLFSFVEQWEELVAAAGSCYYDSWTEFTNELSVRLLLERALGEDSLTEFPQMSAVLSRVREADRVFATLLLPDVKVGNPELPWWRRGVLRRAGSDYAGEVLGLFGVKVEECE